MRKNILITGANRGIGLGIAKELSKQGHSIFGACRTPSEALELSKLNGVFLIELDVTNPHSINQVTENIASITDTIDVLINNAGIISDNKGSMDTHIDEVQKIMETNLYGPWRMSKAFYSFLKNSTDARIINMSSGMGAHDDLHGNYAAYRMSKAALNDLTILMNNELSDVKVNAMCPGWVRTDMGGQSAHRSVEEGADTAVWLATGDSIGEGKFYRDRKEIDW